MNYTIVCVNVNIILQSAENRRISDFKVKKGA